MKTILRGAAAALLVMPIAAAAQDKAKPEDTEQWSPAVPVVMPGKSDTASPPSDAIVLFDGTSLDHWQNVEDGAPAGWTVADGILTVGKKAGNIQTRQSFGSYQLHLEYRIPATITGSGQARGNSGLFLASTGKGDKGYELQILDSYRNDTYVNGQAGAIYKQFPPLANPVRKPGEWQSIDVVWNKPTFAPDGAVETPAHVTAFINGVLVQDDAVLHGETLYIGKPSYTAYDRAPIKLQAHGDASAPISFRNIWVREIN
ncbi:MAG: 3-keto-disaccharide hydrolase [Sphingomonas sp.]